MDQQESKMLLRTFLEVRCGTKVIIQTHLKSGKKICVIKKCPRAEKFIGSAAIRLKTAGVIVNETTNAFRLEAESITNLLFLKAH